MNLNKGFRPSYWVTKLIAIKGNCYQADWLSGLLSRFEGLGTDRDV